MQNILVASKGEPKRGGHFLRNASNHKCRLLSFLSIKSDGVRVHGYYLRYVTCFDDAASVNLRTNSKADISLAWNRRVGVKASDLSRYNLKS